MKCIGIPFVGTALCKTIVVGIAKYVVNAEIGVNGTAKIVTDAPMGYLSLVSTVVMMMEILTGFELANQNLQVVICMVG